MTGSKFLEVESYRNHLLHGRSQEFHRTMFIASGGEVGLLGFKFEMGILLTVYFSVD